ncbi:MAG: Holliday junction resolvase RuvX [Alphaproteobacteria bacterium]|nr:Holliday junction resolvase RuvX [Alphaproteobacteria bacterium]
MSSPLPRLARSTDLVAALAPGARLLGLDVGTKTIGIAVSDPAFKVATPRTTLKRTRLAADLEVLAAEIAATGAGGFVIGLPLNMDGSEGPRVQSVRAFARNLAAATGLPIAFWDERLSTAAVTRQMIDADLSRRRRAAVVDQAAATYILQGFLDSLAGAA